MSQSITKEMIVAYLNKLKPNLEKDGIIEIGLFGSFANDEATIYSDIDVFVKTTNTFDKKYNGFAKASFLEDLRKKIAKHFKKEVDLCDISQLSKEKIADILNATAMDRTIQCVETIIESIEFIESICNDKGDILKALNDRQISKPAILAHLLTISKQFIKLQKHEEIDILKHIPNDIITYMNEDILNSDLDGINIEITKQVIYNLLKLKIEFSTILHEFTTQTPQEQLSREIHDYMRRMDIFYTKSRAKKEDIILNLYKKLKNNDITISGNDLKVIKFINLQRKTKV